MTLSERTYGQYCPIAAGLDVVGDRWTLLICRELAQGDRRYTDLRNALDGIAPNLLSDRLRSLQDAGLVTTCELPPPAARCVYRLTDEGRARDPRAAGHGALRRALPRRRTRRRDERGPRRERAAAPLATSHRCRPARAPRGRRQPRRHRRYTVRDTTPREPVEGDADVVVTTDSASLVRARQGEPLDAEITGTRAAKKAAARGVRAHTILRRLSAPSSTIASTWSCTLSQHARVGEDPEPIGQDRVQDQLPDIIGIHRVEHRTEIDLALVSSLAPAHGSARHRPWPGGCRRCSARFPC